MIQTWNLSARLWGGHGTDASISMGFSGWSSSIHQLQVQWETVYQKKKTKGSWERCLISTSGFHMNVHTSMIMNTHMNHTHTYTHMIRIEKIWLSCSNLNCWSHWLETLTPKMRRPFLIKEPERENTSYWMISVHPMLINTVPWWRNAFNS